MGFTRGFLGGATLTYTLLYLSLHYHRQSRQSQHLVLLQQSILLNSVVEPVAPLPERPAYEIRRAEIVETLKDRWNAELGAMVRRVGETDWNLVRDRWENRLASAWDRVRSSEVGQEVEGKVKEVEGKVIDAVTEATATVTAAGQTGTTGVGDEVKQKAGDNRRLLEVKD